MMRAAPRGMMRGVKRKAIEEVLPLLEAEDAFTRLEAEKRLRDLARRDFGYRWDGSDADRAAALARVRAWLQSTLREEKARRAAAAAAPGLATLDIEKLKGMSPQQMEKHLQALLGKAQVLAGFSAGRPRCEGCGQRPATVEIVEVRSRRAGQVLRLCDPCAAQRGDVRGG